MQKYIYVFQSGETEEDSYCDYCSVYKDDDTGYYVVVPDMLSSKYQREHPNALLVNCGFIEY